MGFDGHYTTVPMSKQQASAALQWVPQLSPPVHPSLTRFCTVVLTVAVAAQSPFNLLITCRYSGTRDLTCVSVMPEGTDSGGH